MPHYRQIHPLSSLLSASEEEETAGDSWLQCFLEEEGHGGTDHSQACQEKSIWSEKYGYNVSQVLILLVDSNVSYIIIFCLQLNPLAQDSCKSLRMGSHTTFLRKSQVLVIILNYGSLNDVYLFFLHLKSSHSIGK